MDLAVLLESPQGSQSSSRVGACTCAFLPSCSSSVTLPFAWIKGSGALPRGFPTRLSLEAFPQGRLQKYPKIHVSTGEESSGSGTDSTQDLRPWHRRERNPERPPSNWHGDWPFLRPPERVPYVPVVSQEHLPQLEKIQEVLPSRRDEAHFCSGVSRLITPNPWNFQRVLHTLATTQEVPQHT